MCTIEKISLRLQKGLPRGMLLINNLIWQDLQKIKFDCKNKLSHFDKPVLIIQGKQDIIEPETALKEHKILKASKLIFLDNCVHYGWLDRPDEYFPKLKSSLILINNPSKLSLNNLLTGTLCPGYVRIVEFLYLII